MFENDVLLSKVSIIRNCVRTIKRMLENDDLKIEQYLLDDIIAVNLQRAVQAAIDAAHVIIARRQFSLPASYKESFAILEREQVIDPALSSVMKKLVGFRNISVHEYQSVSHEIMHSIIRHHLADFERYCMCLLKQTETPNVV